MTNSGGGVNLTLTRVVFEYDVDGEEGKIFEFNFNKSCIWIDFLYNL